MNQAGVYIHIPFCRARCSYCDFATGMYESGVADRYVQAVIREISNWTEVQHQPVADTIYFGGGTPSLLSTHQLEQLLRAVSGRFNVAADAEITIELNPEADNDLSARMLDWLSLGINRASFGAQTFDDRELKQLGRTHTSQDIPQTFKRLREAGFANINFDLIAGLPGQTLEGWQDNLDQALQLRPEHLSLYLLDVHESTPLADQINRGMRSRPDDDLIAAMYLRMVEVVSGAGYEHYEISNFSLPGFASRHNTKYWAGDPYYGFGCSAHSYDGARHRWANERDVTRFLERIENNESPVVERTLLNDENARSESVFLGLRLMRGLEFSVYLSRFGTDLREHYSSALDRLTDAGLVRVDDGMLRLTTRGALLSNEVFAELA